MLLQAQRPFGEDYSESEIMQWHWMLTNIWGNDVYNVERRNVRTCNCFEPLRAMIREIKFSAILTFKMEVSYP